MSFVKKKSQIQAIAIAITLAPALGLAAQFALNGPGANPIEEVTHVTGEWGLRFILLSLAVTPARRFLGWSWAAPLRRTLGLAGFFYAAVHLSTYAYFDLGLDPAAIFEDLTERPYVIVGMAAFLLLLVLAITSTRGWMKRLGARWVKLHQLVYPAALLGVAHHFWLIKADYRPAIVHGVLLAGLLSARVVWKRRSALPSPG
ncbi:MAG: sulfite oxidase heme-binding subunit YedZ [Myxococcota bacterium]